MRRLQNSISLMLIMASCLTGCAALSPIASEDAVNQLRDVGDAYAVVDALVKADTPDALEACKNGTLRPEFERRYCGDLSKFYIMTGTVAFTSKKSSLRVSIPVPKSSGVQKNDIVKFHLSDETYFVEVVSKGERPGCKWVGDSIFMLAIPGQEGGIECDGWSYKAILQINWRPKTWIPPL